MMMMMMMNLQSRSNDEQGCYLKLYILEEMVLALCTLYHDLR